MLQLQAVLLLTLEAAKALMLKKFKLFRNSTYYFKIAILLEKLEIGIRCNTCST